MGGSGDITAASSTSDQGLPELNFDLTRSRNQLLIIESVRLAFHVAILGITTAFQAIQPEFVNFAVLFPIYVSMFAMFLVNAVYLGFFEFFISRWTAAGFLFILESAFITALIFFTGVSQSIFLFLYLVNIILCGFVFGRRGAFFLSLCTSIFFSLLLILGPALRGQTLVFAIGLNNIAFFAVAFLSGILSEQLNFMGSELKARGKDLRALRNLNELILENISTGLITVDTKGEILQANRAAAVILDLPLRTLVSKHVDDILEKISERLNTLVFSGDQRRSERFDWTYVDLDGGRRILGFSVSPLLDGEGEISGRVLAFQDLTKVRRLEFAMRQSEKMAAVGQLAAGIAHEIRNPLASISGSIQLLGQSFSSRQEEEQKLMAIVLKEIDRLNNLITEFLIYVRPEAPVEDPVDINALVREVLEMVKHNQGLRGDVEQKVELLSTHWISGNRDKLKQALLNIVINSYQAMQTSPRAVLEVRTQDRDAQVAVVIRDSGCGIEEARLRKIFEPFHTTKPKGTGLGLAMTHKIVENHAGKIFVESSKGHGTEFTLEFPARDEGLPSSNLGLADLITPTDDLKLRKRSNG